MSQFRLTQAQLNSFETFGFLSLPGLMTDSIAEITAAFEQIWTEHGGGHDGKPHDGVTRSCIVPFLDQHERLCALLDDPRIEGTLCSLLGDDFNYTGSDGNYYAGDTAWHSDGFNKEIRYVKIAFYLDHLTRDSGCLRVIPGSHRMGDGYSESLEKDVKKSQELWGVSGSEVPAVALEVNPGDIVAFLHNTKHAAFGGSERRRMFTINCCERVGEDRIDILKADMEGLARFWMERAYGDKMTGSAGPGRMVHLQQCLANDGHLAALSAKARAQMPEPARG